MTNENKVDPKFLKKFQKGDWVKHKPTGRIGKIVNIGKVGGINVWLVNFYPIGGDTTGIQRITEEYIKLSPNDPRIAAAKEWSAILYDQEVDE